MLFSVFFSSSTSICQANEDFKRMFAFEIWNKIPDQYFSKASNTKSEKLPELQEA